MATTPVAQRQQASSNLLDQWVKESWTEYELGSTGGHYARLAPKAEPEEDIDMGPEDQEETLQENVTIFKIKMADTTKMEHEKPTGVSQHTPRETAAELEQAFTKLSEELQACKKSKKSLNLGRDTFPLPSPLSGSEECPEKEALSSPEGEATECISDTGVSSDAAEELMSSDSPNSHEWTQSPLFTEPADRDMGSTSEETAGDSVKTQEGVAWLNSLIDGLDNSKSKYNLQGVAAKTNSTTSHPTLDRENSTDLFAIDSPPFADEVEEEEEVRVFSSSMDINSCQEQWMTLDSSSKPTQSSYSVSSSIRSEKDSKSAQPAVPSDKQQGEHLPQKRRELAPKGANQEAAQQVLSQASPPLSTVAMELANGGAAASRGSACAVAERERNRRAGEKTERGSRQTGGERGQKESRFDAAKVVGEKHKGMLKYSKTFQKQGQGTERFSSVSSKHSRVIKMESDSYDDSQSDSGVSADLSPCNTLESHTNTPRGIPTRQNETPIEREIRRAVEREHSLRRSRGLQNPPISPEYVEIPLRKSVISQSLPAKSERTQDKDRHFAGKKMQQEIYTEAQREQALVKLGKVPGVYDKGTFRQLKERKKVFEAFQGPKDSSLTISTRSKAPSWSSASEFSTLENQEDISSPASTPGGSFMGRRRSTELLSQTQNPTSGMTKGGRSTSTLTQGPRLSEGTGCQVIILENNLDLTAQTPFPSLPLQHSNSPAAFPETEALSVVDSGTLCASPSRIGGHKGISRKEEQMEVEEDEAVPKENPFFKLRSSTALVKLDIQEAQERERELRKQRSSLYGGTKVARGRGGQARGGRGGGRPASIERQSPTPPSSPLNGLPISDLPASLSKRGSGPPPARQSLGKLGMWPPAQAEEEISRPEVLLSPRTPRQKTPLLQRWEMGLVNGHREEDD
ncbi:uncharacterized protein misp3 [Myripristis murdjan]|uniref:uncharacterized protein misp3 n=1 Tax=Myripristis murdjan TaxID=586833 RepID=UPI001175C990|nr:uncharacterized protein LOC115358281 [Myripristis murdjan]